MNSPGATPPTLWQLRVSHFSEKVRWALAYKGVDHIRRSPFPHIPFALALTRGRHYTFPVLELDGERIGDSTAIIAALEERYPDPALYPADPDERARALGLEDWFDEEAAPYTRRLAFYEVSRDPERLASFAIDQVPAWMARSPAAVTVVARNFVRLRYGAGDPDAAAEARERILAALDRLERELGSEDYLVGGRFTVADLAAAASLYPLVLPPEGPDLSPELMPEPYRRFVDPLRERPGFRWVGEMFRRHRLSGGDREPAAAAA